jgi:hypothetical protein
MVTHPIYLEASNAKAPRLISRASSQQRFDSDKQLCECERFGKIIIRSCFEVLHFIVHSITRRQD